MKRLPALTLVLVFAVAVSACGSRADAVEGPTPRPGALAVVSTTTFLADLVREVGGTNVDVVSLVPKGGDPHTFDPHPSTAMAISNAKLVFANGLGLDDWIAQLAGDVGTGAPVVKIGENLSGASYIESGGETNPHLWLDVAYAELYVGRIEGALEKADPAHAAEYRASATGYRSRLQALDAWVREQVAAIPAANRRIVSFHDALPYFCRAYGLTVIGNVVRAPGQEPSAQEVRALVDAIKAQHVRAIFSEAQFNPDLARTIADETGASVVSNLYTDTLGDPPVNTYEGLIRWDVQQVVEALR